MEQVIKSRIPGIQSLISKTIAELDGELSRLGKPIAADAGVSRLTVKLKYKNSALCIGNIIKFLE